jgi:hypothetical protein
VIKLLRMKGEPENHFKQDLITESQHMYYSIRNILINEVSEGIIEETPTILRLATKIREKSKIFPIKKISVFKKAAGVDGGSQILPLASRRYAVISAIAFSIPEGKRFFLQPESFSQPYTVSKNSFTGRVDIRRETKLFETAVQFIEKNQDLEILLIDGPLVFSNWWKTAGTEQERFKLLLAINKLLNLCRESKVNVVGIVKRPSARYLIYYHGLQDQTDLPDSYLLLHTLKTAERTDIFSPRLALKKAKKPTAFMDTIKTPIYSFYTRLSKDWHIPPIRIDLPAHSLEHLNEIADYCYSTSVSNGLPLPIIKADEEARISKELIGEIYREILGKVGIKTGKFTHLAPYWGEAKWMGA